MNYVICSLAYPKRLYCVFHFQVDEVDERLLTQLSYNARGDICPMQGVIGGITAQEVMKVHVIVCYFVVNLPNLNFWWRRQGSTKTWIPACPLGKQVTEFACQSKFPTCPCLKKFLLLINNSRDMDKDLIKSFMSDRSPSVEHFGRAFTFTIRLIS